MKKYIFIFLISLSSFSQEEICFIYLDAEYIAESGQDRYYVVSEKIDSIMNMYTNSVLYLTNENESVFYDNTNFDKNELLDELEGSGGLRGTDIWTHSDINRINSYFSKNEIIDLNQIENRKINFYFIVSKENLMGNRFSNSFNENLIKPLLLTNKLYTRNDKHKENCKIYILYDDVSNNKSQNLQRINKKITQNYEIKYF